MSSRAVTVAGFVLLATAGLVLHLAGRWHRGGLLPLGALLDRLRSCPPARLALVLAWAWLGWHLLAR